MTTFKKISKVTAQLVWTFIKVNIVGSAIVWLKNGFWLTDVHSYLGLIAKVGNCDEFVHNSRKEGVCKWSLCDIWSERDLLLIIVASRKVCNKVEETYRLNFWSNIYE